LSRANRGAYGGGAGCTTVTAFDPPSIDPLKRLSQFNEKVRAFLSGSKYELALPNVPSLGDAYGNIMQPLDDGLTLWALINADPEMASDVQRRAREIINNPENRLGGRGGVFDATAGWLWPGYAW